MLIKNYRQLARNKIRSQALEIVNAGLEAVQPQNVLRQKIKRDGNNLEINRQKINLDKFQRIFIVGFGKAAFASAKFLEGLLADKISGGLVIDVQQGQLKKIKSVKGSHPYPSLTNLKATEKIIDILKQANQDDLIIVIVSGGGSVLLSKPYRLTPEELGAVIKQLFQKGADIKEINILRKHLSEIHGGRVSCLAWPASVIGLIFSDIPFADLGLVASGPTFFDKSAKKDAGAIIKKYQLSSLPLLETPKNRKYFTKTRNFLMADGQTGLEAMSGAAKKIGFKVCLLRANLRGIASVVGPSVIRKHGEQKGLFLFSGETTVEIKGEGKGGRNQELVLAGLKHLRKGQLIASIASDGKDNIKEAAGALADELTLQAVKKQKLDPKKFLQNNDSYRFFKKTEDIIITGATGANVSDLILLING